ncbi:MAG: MFS transporter [Chthoniobacterales bacterium]
MASKRAQIGIIFLTIFIDMVGFGIVIPILPRYAEHYGATAMQIGWLAGVFSLMQFVFAPLWGKISDRIGRKPLLCISTLGTAVGFYLMGSATTLTFLFVGRIVDGISGGNIGVAQAYIADVTEPAERSKAMGLIGAAFGLGFIFGPALGGWVSSNYGFGAPMYVAGALALMNTVLIFVILPESLPPELRGQKKQEPTFPALFQHVNLRGYLSVIATYFCVITGFSIMTTLFALFVWHRFEMDEKHTGYIFALIGFIGALIQGGLIGRLVKRFGEARLATTGALILGISLFALPLSSSIAGMILVSCILAVGNSLLMPTLSGIASRSVDAAWQGRALGIMQSIGSLARWIGPLFAGWLLAFDLIRANKFYAQTPLWVGAFLLGMAFILSLWLPREKALAADA